MIHTTHKKAIEAYNALNNIYKTPFSLTDARSLMMLMLELEKEKKFNDQELRKIVEKYNPTRLENDMLQFKTVEEREAFEQSISELDGMEIDIGAEHVTICAERYASGEIKITPADLAMLNGFVDII